MTAIDIGSGVLERLTALIPSFARRAGEYDRAGAFPADDFGDLHAAGLNAPTVPASYGGLGLGPCQGDTGTLWTMTSRIAGADLALARCWEGHANSLLLLDEFGTREQKQRWFSGVVGMGDIWVTWSGEPPARSGSAQRFGTTVTRGDGGWIVHGAKAFATSATHADWAILLVDPAGPGGARHTGSRDTVLMLACEMADPSVSLDLSWWDPIGMRATASHVVRFDDTFIPDAQQIGPPGVYLTGDVQAMFAPHYAASFLGAAEAVSVFAVEHVQAHHKENDPYVQHRVGAMAEHLALAAVDHCVRVCGARCLIRPSPVERILRDLSFYVRHDNADHILAAIGRAELGLPYDGSFAKP
ncbi:MAG TPA: acyl-CoA dehydrogenase family protein [Amycolatopsis sp.]|nr:acyl-CoA dehydrogenase family protein [Amycolatopsis sp.]